MNTEADTIAKIPAGETDENSLLSIADALRVRFFATVSLQHQKEFGQFLTRRMLPTLWQRCSTSALPMCGCWTRGPE